MDKNTLKSWFSRGKKPLASQFAAWIDSYWHKEEKIPINSVQNLSLALNGKMSASDALPLRNSVMITHNELLALRNASSLVPGTWYRITDYVTIIDSTAVDARSVGKPFDILVLATGTSTLSEECRATANADDNLFEQANLNAWKVWYTIDNDKTKYDWANTASGKGVIYRLIDEWENDCPYDFKNIQFVRKLSDGYLDEDSGIDTYVYTFTWFDENNEVKDLSVVGNSLTNYEGVKHGVFCNLIKEVTAYWVSRWSVLESFFALGNNVFLYHQSTEFCGCYRNIFGLNCHSNTFSDITYLNTFGNNCSSNTFSYNCYLNTFGNNCSSNTFSYNCYLNTFGNNCSSNTFGSNCCYNTFGYNSCSNTFSSNCCSNTFGSNCCSNTFGSNCYYNTFENSSGFNTFGNSCSYNTFGNECSYNTFGNECSYNTFRNFIDSNTFGYGSMSNTFGDICKFNTFGDNCNFNTFGDNCISNTFGCGCSSNTFGNVSGSNTFGNNCLNNTFGDHCELNNFYHGMIGSTTPKDSIKNITLENNVNNNNFYSNLTTGWAQFLQGIRIIGLEGSSTEITLSETNTNYEWRVCYTSDGTLKQYCPDD